MRKFRPLPIVAIIGGGFSGAAVALHLTRNLGAERRARIVVFEPRARLGAGLAYDTAEPAHRINVPAFKMSLYPDEPESFADYLVRADTLATDPVACSAEGVAYPRRSVFGDYVAAELAPCLAGGLIEHRRKRVLGVKRSQVRWTILAEDAEVLVADIVVLAVSHPPPSLPKALLPISSIPKLVADSTRTNALDGIAPADRVLVVGNGLTAADVVAALTERGHRGPVISISRRGLRSRGHPAVVQDPFGDFVSEPVTRASELLRRIRRTLRVARQRGLSWHPVIDAVRAQGQQIWQALPVVERRRIARLARVYWDVHRFRIAPQVEDVLDQAIENGRLEILSASVASATIDGGEIRVDLRQRGLDALRSIIVDAIVVTTGPAHGGILKSQPFLAGLEKGGVLTVCETGLGIACDLHARAVGADRRVEPNLFIAGPLARGTFGELMGLPQVTEHAVFVALEVKALLLRGEANRLHPVVD
ncbi:putative NAD(P)/FAD-binding protein YdhS [Sinorhizobium fredii]|uniref:Hydroxyacylglutathione hydrolase n=1 Tax=Sinorhizobium fredii (strain USDA 257) TaxID=1185652 RepID=I3X1Z7_SINF2|nr:FAD/NAD(P)-binding protein [Sinorhizobium fredii]AFL49903.1 hydroxyacylglutathione hydrolase [Sinorhizobium fredii USDA 257]